MRWRACATALLLTNGAASLGNARSRLSSTSLIDQCRYIASAMTSHTTCSAGRRRRRMLAVPVASTARSIHS
jgi:hypothetical protein